MWSLQLDLHPNAGVWIRTRRMTGCISFLRIPMMTSSVICCARRCLEIPLSRLQMLLLVMTMLWQMLLLVMTMLWQLKRKLLGLRVLTDVARVRDRVRSPVAVAVDVLAVPRHPRRLRAARSPRARTASVAADVRRPAKSCALQNACTDRKLHVML